MLLELGLCLLRLGLLGQLLGLRRLARDLLVLRLELLLLWFLELLGLLYLLLDRCGVGGGRVEGHGIPPVMALLPAGLLVHRQGQ
ncbi:hypothetical protein [Streptomyces malaysiensis]|uniref:hypothetical protein n=1 Tax=Streptomyces malaysiensis TaxID=92644 RepID=UPI001928AF8B|nr:hypothetical protein [Streptomyces sp. SID8382]